MDKTSERRLPELGDCELCRYEGGVIEQIGAAEIERWEDVLQVAESTECLLDSLLGWDNYSHLYAVTMPNGDVLHYLVRLSEATDTVNDPLARGRRA